MAHLTLEPAIQERLEEVAQFLGRPAEEIVSEAVLERLEKLNHEKLEEEISAFERMHSELKPHYERQFVAIHQKTVVDSDADFEPLFLRVQARFGEIAVLIRQVAESPNEEWYFRSPRITNGV
jgi:predicted DNA-binding protein